jgi:hypothetical protein
MLFCSARIEPRPSSMLGKCSPTELLPPLCKILGYTLCGTKKRCGLYGGSAEVSWVPRAVCKDQTVQICVVRAWEKVSAYPVGEGGSRLDGRGDYELSPEA